MTEGEKPKYRKEYEVKSIKLGRILAKSHLTPNQITVLSILVAVLSLYYFYNKDLLTAFIVIIVAGILDIFDGAVARATGKSSKFGTVLDNTSDRIVEMVLLLGLSLGGFIPGWLGVLTISSMLLPSYVRARGEAEIGVYGLGVGFFERKEKLGTLFAGMLIEYFLHDLIASSFVLPNVNYPAIYLACIIVSVFSLITAVQRLVFYRKAEQRIRNEKSD